MNTPTIIKYQFWHMTYKWPNAKYGCINLREASVPDEIEGKSICINGDIEDIIEELLEENGGSK